MTCKCKNPPCICKPEDRDNKCEHKIQGDYVEEQRKLGMFKGWKMHNCGMNGTLQNDCNYFWESKLVLCDKHIDQHRASANRLCGICGQPKRECCC